MEITITPITRSDVPHYIEFLRAGFGPELTELGTDLNWLGHIIRFLLAGNELPLRTIKRVSGHEAFVLIARAGADPIGCITVVGRQPALTGVYVVPAFRGRGIAMRLVNDAVHRLRAAGYDRAIASPLNHVAQHLIETVGFVPINRTVVYEHPLPLEIASPPGVRLRRMRTGDVPPDQRGWHGRRYNVHGVGWLLGVHMRQLTAVTADGPAACARLFAINRERVGEIHPLRLAPGDGKPVLSLFTAGVRWFTRLGKETVHVSLDPRDEELVALVRAVGFSEKREWVEFALDLAPERHHEKTGADRSAPA